MSKDNVLIKFGNRIRLLRKQNDWSQEDLSFKSGFHRTYIGMIERGERNPSLKNISVFANTFNISLSELLKLEINEMG
ncbi:helix-turn-helix domain-containing protein [Imtechella halotolerans]|uniref:XRE family transcriptional regulator n=1 Tax=Imtechella halotolerans K1 TaxID=946077 RepID=I0WB81_9FLAO|nr:helix-turn-helix transcriptional regulator [Imtechella halotolerans]EID73647.1 XRE family transcriptional regulator [Imtechella halotolerans K1]WMQ64715.1 helix-turn-helix transcriptional regulator [Imtechella halotolerans]